MSLQPQLEQLRDLDDDSLLRSLKRHVGSSNRRGALVLAHLAEVDARGAYRQWACDTLAAYCVYELRLSEDEAQRRCRAVRVARQFPVLFDMLADASIHLTGILLLAPYLTEDNHLGLLARARYRRKREIERLVAELAPARDVPALIEPLGIRRDVTAPARPRNTWAAITAGSMGWVRQLKPGDGPVDAPSASDAWHDTLVDALDAESDAPARSDNAVPMPAATEQGGCADAPARDATTDDLGADAPARDATADDLGPDAPARPCPDAADPDSPLRAAGAEGAPRPPLLYKVQFTADQAYVDLLERARGLLWHQLPSGDLVQLQRLALEALVEKLMRRKCGAPARSATPQAPGTSKAPATSKPSETSRPSETSERPDIPAPTPGPTAPARDATADDMAVAVPASPARPCPDAAAPDSPLRAAGAEGAPRPPPSASRHIPTAVRRSVWQRDGGRCTFVDARGVRCRATGAIEFHHLQPHARGGPPSVDNIRLRCRSHNELAAERDFGRDFVLAMKQRERAP